MTLAVATRLGPYEILGPLGAGGMGEVYRASDTRLDRVVALKVLPEEFLEGEERKARFGREARTLASLNHPNIATLFSFEEIPGPTPSSRARHVLTMELLEGESLREVILRRSPTTRQVLSWALQAAQGLSAAHAKGIVHRDIKPENLFLTSDGRIKILDFGLAKLTARTPVDRDAATESGLSVPGVIVGTVAYMSPEQIEAEGLDARTDVFSLGIVLYELLAREHPFRRPTVPATLTAIVNETPPDPSLRQPGIQPGVDRIVRRCLEKRREERYQSAQELAAALEAVLEGGSSAAALRDVDEKSPYPGLSSFTEEDAGRFFGREDEVAQLWRKIHDRNLLAVIGPSGAGKTSFVRAGLIPSRPEGWAAIVAMPGNAPLRSLGQALGPQLASDPEALRRLAAFEDGDTAFELISRWRRSHEDALLVVDQFEELFTLNPQETQERFATLLGRLASEANVHVLLSLRDDFLMRGLGLRPLAPIIDALTPLQPMTREGLRRALVEPAAKRGYRFEDDALVDEMIAAVEGARSALPLLAFAVSRLWEKRNVDEKLLTREAYAAIGGVAGALARHADEALDRIGASLEPTVRDIFRNLTTAQGTRAVLDREELLSALPDRTAAEAVLGKLIDARLLTSWETEGTEGQPAHDRVEIVHESLLSAWPRLVRWQTQDADGAQLRDQLRQAAHLWEERGKADDLLWTGSTYLDYRVWRGRYPGKLSSLEEDFAESMKARSERARRRRRTAVGSVLVALLVGLGAMALLWNSARVHGIRAEASKLLAMAEAEVGTDPESALAYATKSLELDDTPAARLFALRVTQSAPVASELASGVNNKILTPTFSPNGEWLALQPGKEIRLLNQDGREPATISSGEPPPGLYYPKLEFAPDGKALALGYLRELRLLSLPDGREIRRVTYEEGVDFPVASRTEGSRHTFFLRPWDGGPQRLIGTLELSSPASADDFAPDFTKMAYALGSKIYAHSLNPPDLPPRLVGEHAADVTGINFSASGQRLAAVDKSGEIRIWDAASSSGSPLRVLPAPAVQGSVGGKNTVSYSPAGGWVIGDTGGEGTGSLRAWNMRAPPGAGPLVLRTRASNFSYCAVDPLDRGVVLDVENGSRFLFWPLPRAHPFVFDFREGSGTSVAFTADGATLVASTVTGALRAWPLSAESATAFRTLPRAGNYPRIAAAPTRREIAVATRGNLRVIGVDGGEPRALEGPPPGLGFPVAFSPDGKRVAAAPRMGPPKEKRLRVWDLESGAVQALEPVPNADDEREGGFVRISFVGDDRVLATVQGVGLLLYDLRAGTGRVLSSRINRSLVVGTSGRVGFGTACNADSASCEILRFDLEGNAPVPLAYESGWVNGLALDPTETLLASTGPDGVVRVGPISGGEPHLLLGHKGWVNAVAFSPDGKWLATAGDDQTVRLWPVPDVTQVPPQKRSKEEFLATLHTFTNLRAVPDQKAPNGWKVVAGSFRGWQSAPHW